MHSQQSHYDLNQQIYSIRLCLHYIKIQNMLIIFEMNKELSIKSKSNNKLTQKKTIN